MTTIYCPSKEKIENLKVGDYALTPFGKLARVTEIYGRGIDSLGRTFVCYYTESGSVGSTISCSMTEGHVHRSCNLPFTSAQIDKIEREMNAAGEEIRIVD